MADRLERIYGTEDDAVNCAFWLKTGACRNGDRCSRLHAAPILSGTLKFENMYEPPLVAPDGSEMTEKMLDEHFNFFYEDVFNYIRKVGGNLERMEVCANLAEHLRGNVYAVFEEEEHAEKALNSMNGMFYAGKPIWCEFTPVSDFKAAICRPYEESECRYGDTCKFMHLCRPKKSVLKRCFGKAKKKDKKEKKKKGGSRSRSRSRSRDRDRDKRKRSRSDSRDRGKDKKESMGDMSETQRRNKIEEWNQKRMAAASEPEPVAEPAPSMGGGSGGYNASEHKPAVELPASLMGAIANLKESVKTAKGEADKPKEAPVPDSVKNAMANLGNLFQDAQEEKIREVQEKLGIDVPPFVAATEYEGEYELDGKKYEFRDGTFGQGYYVVLDDDDDDDEDDE